jgi:hypothetical protein
MNGLRLTDAQISKALRVHLPERARAGLRERILESTAATPQQRGLPSFLGALSDADPVMRRRSMLIAAALLVAVALASAAAVGAWRLLDRDPVQNLTIEPPADVQAFVQSSDDRMPELPPVAFTTLDSDARKARIYVDRSGAVRIERYASTDATEPATTMIVSGNRFARSVTVGPDTVWVEQDEAIGEDPRVFIPGLGGLGRGVSCESTGNPDDVGNATATTGWRYVGAEEVAGRPAHHVACDGDLWIDDETRLILRSRAPLLDDGGQPIPGAFHSIEVTEIEFAEQPAALFDFAPPPGIAPMSIEAYLDLCGPGQAAFLEGPPCSGTPPIPEGTSPPEPSPTSTALPIPSDCAVPTPGPSDPAGPLTWTEESLKEDWPAPARSEPAGGAIVQAIPATIVDGQTHNEYVDPSGDTGSICFPWVDIEELEGFGGFRLASNQPPAVDPAEQWIAYGFVFDVDRDGLPDWRYGIDNMPIDARGERPHRAWITDLHTGRTESAAGPPYGIVGKKTFDSFYPTETAGNGAHWLIYGGDVAAGGSRNGRMGVYYLWASVINDGRVVATDYAPDLGWLDPTLLGAGQNEARPFEPSNEHTVCVVPPQPGCRETDRDDAIGITLTLPDGWAWNDSDNRVDVRGKRVTPRDGLIKPATGMAAPRGMRLQFLRGGWLFSDPCRKVDARPEIRVGPTANDFANALADHPLLDVTTPVPVTLGGFKGKYLDLHVPSNIADCTVGYHPWAPAYYAPGSNQRWHIWSLNVDGVRVVIVSEDFPGTSAQDLAEMRAIIESIQINP